MTRVYAVIDFNTNTRWALFDDNKRCEIVSYFKSCNKPEDFTVVTFDNGKETSRCNLLEF